MKSFLVGIGQCGGKLATDIVKHTESQNEYSITGALAVNTAQSDLAPLPIDTQLIGQDVVKGSGVGSDNERGVEVMRRDVDMVLQTIAEKISTTAESIILTAGLGGGTGSGGTPVVAEELAEQYDIPVYGLGVLPSDTESSLRVRNAARSLITLRDYAEATILVDNTAWRQSGQTLEEYYDQINTEIAEQLSLLFTAGEINAHSSESVVDSSEIINTLAVGDDAALGYGSAPAGDTEVEHIRSIKTATRKAIQNGLSMTGEVSAEAALVLTAGPPKNLSRKGVEKARGYVEDEMDTYQVRGGDLPLPESDTVEVVTLLSGIDSHRVADIMAEAEETDQQHGVNKTDDEDDVPFQTDELDSII